MKGKTNTADVQTYVVFANFSQSELIESIYWPSLKFTIILITSLHSSAQKTRRLGITKAKPLLLNCLTGSVTLEVVKRKMLKDPIWAIICVSSTEKCNYSAGGAHSQGFEQPAWNNALLSAWSNSGRKTERLLSGLDPHKAHAQPCPLELGIVSVQGVHRTRSPASNAKIATGVNAQTIPRWPTFVFPLQFPHLWKSRLSRLLFFITFVQPSCSSR